MTCLWVFAIYFVNAIFCSIFLNFFKTIITFYKPENQEGAIDINTGITIPNDEVLVSDDDSIQDKKKNTTVQTKAPSKPKKQKSDKISNAARKRKEITERLSKLNKSKSNVIEEEVREFRMLHF